jgi:hypothetical protein
MSSPADVAVSRASAAFADNRGSADRYQTME